MKCDDCWTISPNLPKNGKVLLPRRGDAVLKGSQPFSSGE
jgi:hypothetical protein